MWSPRSELEPDPVDSESGVRLDQELETSSATAMRYSAVAEILNRELQLDALAVSGSSGS